MLFHYNIDKMIKELNTCLYQLSSGKLVSLYAVSLKVAEPIDDIK